ncbi:MAG TPA: cyanophycin synthetase [Kofleriaceae bacterium]|nr:cyanophycin synthetase [Kofleriaceae bacterium]
MTYRALLEWLYGARRAGVKLELSRMAAHLERLGHPERRFRATAQVAGTNGKGSTVAYLEAALGEAGVVTGAFSSPHLLRFCERFRVAGVAADESALGAAGERVRAADPGGELTFFERATAMAAVVLAEANVDVAIFEVGLGGRFDATTAIIADVAAVTGVALDHQAYLGDTIPAIAAEKAAIFRRGQRAVIGCGGEPCAVPLLRAAAAAAGVDSIDVVDPSRVAGIPLAMAGEHQRANAACALAVAENLASMGAVRHDAAAFARGLSRATVRARLERVATAPAIVVDGAHNPHAAQALARWLATAADRPLWAVCGVAADKDIAGVVAPVAPLCDGWIATGANNPRAADPAIVAGAARRSNPLLEVTTCASVGGAIDDARAGAGETGMVIVFGSLMVCGEALAHITGAAADPIVLTDPVGALIDGKSR